MAVTLVMLGGASGCDLPPTEVCDPVRVVFDGTVATVAGSPLGLDGSVRTTAANGSFTYSPCTSDERPMDPRRGDYDHAAGRGPFVLEVGGRSVVGSGGPLVEVEDLDPDTFRFEDGAIPFDDHMRVVTVDGAPARTVEVWFAITDSSGAAFAGDALPAIFPFAAIATRKYPHTFSVKDAGGTLLLQLSSLRQEE